MSSVTRNFGVNGTAGREGVDVVFGTILNAAGNAHAATLTMLLQTPVTVDHFQALRRGFMVCDPTLLALPTGFIITAATVNLTPGAVPTDDFVQYLCVTEATMINALAGTANGDYEGTASGRTEYASNRVALASLVNGTPVSWTMNATALTYINAQYNSGDPIVMGLRWSCDIDQTSPTWVGSKTDSMAFSTPQLVLTYRVGPGHAVVSVTGQLGNSADTVGISLFTVELIT